jgi:two-component system, OmpR family, response regulator VicR
MRTASPNQNENNDPNEPTERARVLVADDRRATVRLFEKELLLEGFIVLTADNAYDALKLAINHAADVYVLDLEMPERRGQAPSERVGIKLATDIRDFSLAPILFLSAHHREELKVSGLNCGADDYLPKPTTTGKLLVASIRAKIRRHNVYVCPPSRPVMTLGRVAIDPDYRRVTRDGRWVYLSDTEFDILNYLASHIGRVVTSDELFANIWGGSSEVSRRVVQITIHQLRAKLEPNPREPQYVVSRLGGRYEFCDGDR